jgi:FixJ family two-component response regulator
MPGLSGIELQTHLMSRGNRTPMIFVTASLEEMARARALNGGAIGFMPKPFNEERLIEYIRLDLAVDSAELRSTAVSVARRAIMGNPPDRRRVSTMHRRNDL